MATTRKRAVRAQRTVRRNASTGGGVAAADARGSQSSASDRADAPGAGWEKQHEQMIAEAAYYRAEKRGFAPGRELDDWIAAEADIAELTSAVLHREPVVWCAIKRSRPAGTPTIATTGLQTMATRSATRRTEIGVREEV
jgi:Protein of unknown function (DUF2934)